MRWKGEFGIKPRRIGKEELLAEGHGHIYKPSIRTIKTCGFLFVLFKRKHLAVVVLCCTFLMSQENIAVVPVQPGGGEGPQALSFAFFIFFLYMRTDKKTPPPTPTKESRSAQAGFKELQFRASPATSFLIMFLLSWLPIGDTSPHPRHSSFH